MKLLMFLSRSFKWIHWLDGMLLINKFRYAELWSKNLLQSVVFWYIIVSNLFFSLFFLLKLLTTNPPTNNSPTHQPLATYPQTQQKLTHQLSDSLSSIQVKIKHQILNILWYTCSGILKKKSESLKWIHKKI